MNKFVCIQKPNKTEIRLGDVENHCDLVLKNEKCSGGGYYKVEEEEKTVILWDKSFDYGYPKFTDTNTVDELWKDYTFYYVPDLFMPLDDCYLINVEFEEL